MKKTVARKRRKNNILLCCTGSIAAYKACIIASLLVKDKFNVKTILTDAATHFIGSESFRSITGARVYREMFDPGFNDEDHVSLSKWADMIVIAPATANTIAKIASGFSDNLLTSVVLDFTGKILIAPAMHNNMWKNPATKENIDKLKSRGVLFVGPEKGRLASGDMGYGRMSEPEKIVSAVKNRS